MKKPECFEKCYNTKMSVKKQPVNLIKRNCPLCNADNSSVPKNRYSSVQWALKKCACGFVYIDSALDYRHLFSEMDWDTTFTNEAARKKRTHPFLQAVSKLTRFRMKFLPKRTMAKYILSRFNEGNILDLGCGGGEQIMELAGRFVPFGIDISTRLAQRADAAFRQHNGNAVNASAIEGLKKFPAGFFAVASLRSYLEHEMNPQPVLLELHRVLKTDGFAVVKVPNYACWNRKIMGKRWCGFRFPDHLNYFTPQTLGKMADACGFRIDFGITGCMPTNDNMWAVITKKSCPTPDYRKRTANAKSIFRRRPAGEDILRQRN